MVKVNMMCGKRNFGPDWEHVDKGFSHTNTDDIGLISQFDNSIDLIYCSHGIAYFGEDELKEILKYWIEKLKPGGALQIATPDWEVIRLFEQPMIGPIYGKMYLGKTHTEIYHRTIYTFESLSAILREAGFVNIHRYDHTKTCHPNTGDRADKYDDHSAAYHNGALISLNIAATKP